MKHLKLSALTVSMLAVMASQAGANAFVNDATVDLDFKTRYNKYQTPVFTADGYEFGKDQQAAGQAIELGFSSGYWNNMFGLDLNFYHGFKLYGDDGESHVGMFPDNGKADNFTKFGYAVKAKITSELEAKYGRMMLSSPLLTNGTELMPSLTEALHLGYTAADFSVYGVRATKFSNELDSEFHDLGKSGDDNAVQLLGGQFMPMDNTTLNVAYGQQAEYARQFYADVSHIIPAARGNVHLGAQYGMKDAIGDMGDSLINDDSINFYGLKAAFEMDSLLVSFSMVDISGKAEDDHSWADADSTWQGMDNTSNTFAGYNSTLIGEFDRAGQSSMQIRADYDFSGMVNGLGAAVAYTNSNVNVYMGDDADENEFNVFVDYAIPMIDGLSLNYSYGDHESEQVSSKNIKEHELMLNYSLPIKL